MGTYKMTMSEQSVLADWPRYEAVCRKEQKINRERLQGQTIEAAYQQSHNGTLGGRPKHREFVRCKKTKQKTS